MVTSKLNIYTAHVLENGMVAFFLATEPIACDGFSSRLICLFVLDDTYAIKIVKSNKSLAKISVSKLSSLEELKVNTV